jgi:hypothetical protein
MSPPARGWRSIIAAVAWLLFGGGLARPTKPATPTLRRRRKDDEEGEGRSGGAVRPMVACRSIRQRIDAAAAPVRVAVDGSTVIGTVHAEEIAALIMTARSGSWRFRARASARSLRRGRGVGQARLRSSSTTKTSPKKRTQPWGCSPNPGLWRKNPMRSLDLPATVNCERNGMLLITKHGTSGTSVTRAIRSSGI